MGRGAGRLRQPRLSDGHEVRHGRRRWLRSDVRQQSVYWSPATGARIVKGVIRGRWLRAGGVKGRFGYPVAEQRTITGGWSQRFQHGTLTYRNGRWI